MLPFTIKLPESVNVSALILLSFNNTPSIVTPEPLVFSWIVFTSKVPEIWVFPVWPSTNNPILPWFLTSKSIQLICPAAETIFLLPTLKLLAVIVELVPAFIEFPFTTTPPIVTPEPLVFSWIVFTSKVPEIWVFPVCPSTNNPILPWFFNF